MKLEDLQKKRQILYSWSLFYSNNINSLAVTRYNLVDKTVNDKYTKENKVVKTYPNISDEWNRHYGNSIEYSQRHKEDKVKSKKLSDEILENQKEIDKLFNNKK